MVNRRDTRETVSFGGVGKKGKRGPPAEEKSVVSGRRGRRFNPSGSAQPRRGTGQTGRALSKPPETVKFPFPRDRPELRAVQNQYDASIEHWGKEKSSNVLLEYMRFRDKVKDKGNANALYNLNSVCQKSIVDKVSFMRVCHECAEPLRTAAKAWWGGGQEKKVGWLGLDTLKLLVSDGFFVHVITSVDEGKCNNHTEERIDQLLDSQDATPEKLQEPRHESLRARGLGVSRGNAIQGHEEDIKSMDVPLWTCASCGFRPRFNKESFKTEDVKSLHWAELDDDKRLEHLERMAKPPLCLPINAEGGEGIFETWRAYSRWPAKKPDELTNDTTLPDWMFCRNSNNETNRNKPKYFHLHPEFVQEFTDDDGRKDFEVRLCGKCREFEPSEKNKAPMRSIAKGVDFGSPSRVGLVPLTSRERQIISPVRHYQIVVKIESNTGRRKEHTHSAIKGHSIIFDHDSPRVVRDLLSAENINDSIDIHFVGPDGQYDHLAKKALGSALVSARPFAVYQWLSVLGEVNEMYSDCDALPKFDSDTRRMSPPIEKVTETIDGCNKALVENALLIATDDEITKETDIARDDIREVRESSGRNKTASASNVDENDRDIDDGDEDSDPPMHFSYLTKSKKTAYDMNTDDTHDYLVSVARELGVNIGNAKAKYNESNEATKTEWMSYREQDPFNEFLGGASGRKDEGLVKAFPDVFFLGKGYDSNRPSLNEERVEHLLMQFTTNAASCRPLLFYLFDQLQRHGSIKGMHAKRVNKENEFAKFAEEFTSDSFREKLKEAIKDPHGKIGKEVMKKVEPILTGGGKLSAYGALARADTGKKIMAMRRRHACAPAFLTFAIDDINHPSSLRMAMSSSSNSDFPAVVSGEHHEAMKHGFKCYFGKDEISIPASYSDRLKLLVNNPVGAACVYKQLVIDVLSILVGKRPGFGQKAGTTRTTEFASWEEENLGAIIGTPIAYLGVTETTGGGSLHFHVVLWGGLSPDILELVADLPELCKQVGSVLDSTYKATLPREIHVRDLVTKDLKRNCDSSQAFKRRDAAASAMQVPPDPVEARDEFRDFTYCTVCGRNIHEHSHTCYKPPNGFHGCRMFRPAGDSDGTKAIELFWNTLTEESEEKKMGAVGPTPEDSKYDFSPLTSPDSRTLLWELDRSKIEGLPALECGLDDEKAKADIISKLSEAIWDTVQPDYAKTPASRNEAKTQYSPSEVDTYTFFDDQDSLFHGMLKGLVVAGVLPAHDKSVKDLRMELMNWLRRHPNDEFRGKTLERFVLEKSDHQTNLSDYIAEANQPGGELELYLFSKAKGVNVHLYTEDLTVMPEKFVHGEVFEASRETENAKDFYFVKRSGEDCYKLFVPKRNAILRELHSLSLGQLCGLYDRVAKQMEDRNGWVVEYNPLLTSLLGCNTNLAFLGSKEQSKQALFYIGPYINKNGVKVVDALPLLAHAQNHALQYPSSADDADTNTRLVQYIMTRVLNKLNSMMEISDTQAALALLGMGPTVCSDIFSYYDLRSTKNFVLDEYFGQRDSLDDVGVRLDRVDDADSIGDEDSFATVSVLSDDGDEDNDRSEMDDGCDGDVMGVNDDSCSRMDGGSDNGRIIENSVYSDVGTEHNDSSDDENEDAGAENGDDDCENNFFDEESSDEETLAEPVQFKGSPTAVPMNYVSGEHGQGKLIKTYSPESLHSIPYPVFYRHRGEWLKWSNRLEYHSLVQVKRRAKESGTEGSEGRPKSKEFPFGRGLEERIGGDRPGRCFQYLRSKQCTPQFFSSPARHPGSRTSDPEKEKVWKRQADKFACDYLIMFRPEPELCEEDQSCSCEYDWGAFEDFVLDLKRSDNAVDHSRLEQIERMVHSWGVSEEKKDALTHWRGRSRTLWSAEDKKLANIEYAKFKKGMFGGDGDDEIVCDGVGVAGKDLSLRQKRDALNMISHGNELMTELNKLHSNCKTRDKEHATGSFQPARTIKFDKEFACRLARLKPADENEENSCPDDRRCHIVPDREAKVDAYLDNEDLSSDKTPVIDKIREHFRAIRDGRSQQQSYDAPVLLLCGGPGNGKSKLVETVGDISMLMGVGVQIKTAYLGVAAVNIGGSSMCSLFEIPTERQNVKGGVNIKQMILPWSEEKKRNFTKLYDINKISCIVVDEISTLQPYMLAYLSARLMELLPESGKDFGGVAVILCGDFDQLPPVAGDNLAKATMKHEELHGPRGNIDRWNTTKHCVNVHKEGLRLFQKAIYFELTEQHRSKDPGHTAMLNRMRRTGKVNVFDLRNKCKLLKEEDVAGDGDFRFATTLVTGNEERHKINNYKADDWVSRHGTTLTRWLRNIDLSGWKGRPRSAEHIKHAMANNECFYELFVPGARAFLTHNINTSIGLANGTEVKYDSISFSDPVDDEEYHKHLQLQRCCPPGGVVTLHKPPSSINVELYADFPGDSEAQKKKNAAKRQDWQHGSLASDNRIVIPISTKYSSYVEWETANIPALYPTSHSKVSGVTRRGWCQIYGVSKAPLKDYFCIEPGFCITIHKAEGRTIHRLILSISDHPHHRLRHKWEGLYVGLSRVEYSEHMRLLLKRGDWGTTKLLRDLERCKHTECFFGGYNRMLDRRGMRWNRQLARTAAEKMELFGQKKSATKNSKKGAKKSSTVSCKRIRRRKIAGVWRSSKGKELPPCLVAV